MVFAGILLTCFLVGCGEPDTFVQFQVEGQSHEVKNPNLIITRLPKGFQFFNLTYAPMSAIPGAMVQWQMKVESPKKLVGQELDLNTVDFLKVRPMFLLRLSEDLTLQNQKDSDVHFKIDRIEEGRIEGTFSGTNLKFVSKKQKIDRTVDVTARFRAKLVEKRWEDDVRSRKRSSK